MSQFFTYLLFGLVGAGLVYSVIALLLSGSDDSLPPAPGARPPAVTVLKPMHGTEPALLDNLRQLCAHGHAGPVQIIFGLASAADPALAVIEQIRRDHPESDISIVVDAARHGANAKMSNIINMAPHIRHAVVMIADSDVAAPAGTISQLAAMLDDPAVGVVSCLHAGRGDAGFWSRLAAMDISYRYMPSVMVGRGLRLAHPVMGPMMALRADTLAAIGGFAAFADVLADDYEIGRAVRGLGLRLAVPSLFITHACSEPSLSALVRHELRWTRTIYGIDRPGFAGSLVTHVLPLSLMALAVAGAGATTLGLVAASLLVRIATKFRIDGLSKSVSGPIILLPLRDILSLLIFLATFFVGTVDWRGSRFTVTADGRLLPKRQI